MLAGDGAITLELNAASTVGSACQATLVARNGFDQELTDFGLDIVVFDEAGGVSDMSALSLGAMPAGKTRVLRFNIAKRGCDKVSSVLVNDVRTCKGEGGRPRLPALPVSRPAAVSISAWVFNSGLKARSGCLKPAAGRSGFSHEEFVMNSSILPPFLADMFAPILELARTGGPVVVLLGVISVLTPGAGARQAHPVPRRRHGAPCQRAQGAPAVDLG